MPSRGIVEAMASPRVSPDVTVTLHLDLGTETITGTMETGDGAKRPFWGWVELSNGLDEARGAKASLRGLPHPTQGALA